MMEILLAFLFAHAMISAPTTLRPPTERFSQTETSIVTVAVSPRHADLVLREPVDILLSIHNAGREPAAIDLGLDRKSAITVKARLPEGTEAVAHIPPHGGVLRRGRITVEPGDTYSQSLILDEWMKFATPGTYHVTILLDNPVTKPDGSTFALDSADLLVRVGQPDGEILRRFCEYHLNKLLAARDYESAARDAESLSAVEDQVAISYLLQAFQTPYDVGSIFADALERLGGEEAIEGLLQIIEKEPANGEPYIRNALNRLAAKTTDSNLRARIRAALEHRQAGGRPLTH